MTVDPFSVAYLDQVDDSDANVSTAGMLALEWLELLSFVHHVIRPMPQSHNRQATTTATTRTRDEAQQKYNNEHENENEEHAVQNSNEAIFQTIVHAYLQVQSDPSYPTSSDVELTTSPREALRALSQLKLMQSSSWTQSPQHPQDQEWFRTTWTRLLQDVLSTSEPEQYHHPKNIITSSSSVIETSTGIAASASSSLASTSINSSMNDADPAANPDEAIVSFVK